MVRLINQNAKLALDFDDVTGYYTSTEDFKITWQVIYDAFVSQLSTDNDFIESDTSAVSGSTQVRNILIVTQAQYDAITPDANTVYHIVG